MIYPPPHDLPEVAEANGSHPWSPPRTYTSAELLLWACDFHVSRYKLSRPLRLGNFVYATDGYVCVRYPESAFPGIESTDDDKPPPIEKLDWSFDRGIPLHAPAFDSIPWPTWRAEREYRDCDCPECVCGQHATGGWSWGEAPGKPKPILPHPKAPKSYGVSLLSLWPVLAAGGKAYWSRNPARRLYAFLPDDGIALVVSHPILPLNPGNVQTLVRVPGVTHA